MGFAIMPEEPKPGVWMHKPTGELIYVERNVFIWHAEIWHKKFQRKPREILHGHLFLHFERLSDL